MATERDNCFLSESTKNNSISNNDTQFTNFNLNQNQESSDIHFVSSKLESSENDKSQNKDLNKYDKQSKIFSFCALDKKDLSFSPSEYLNDSQKGAEQNQWKKESDINKTKGSTLSLHISAYENDTVADNVILQNLPCKDMDSGKRLEATKHYFSAESTAAMFELPRQKTDESMKPEIMQYQASQKLINPNQGNRRDVKNNDFEDESEFQKFKEKANILFQEEKYNEAIKAYSNALELSNLSSENQAVIYSNRSASYLMLGNSLNSAKIDAEKAIKCWPSWWKGYYRLARVNVLQKEWKKAEENVKIALLLNPESKLALDELYDVRQNAAGLFVNDPATPEQIKNHLCQRFNLSDNEMEDPEKMSQHLSERDFNLIRGYQYKLGIFVDQDFKKAIEYFTKSADMDDSEAMYQLAKLYLSGKGVKQDHSEYYKWTLKATNSKLPLSFGGVCDGHHILGAMHAYGIGVNKDYRKAAEWYKKCIKNGCARSARNLGNIYSEGLGLEKSDIKAFYYYKYGAEEGDTSAMRQLAECYLFAEGTLLKVPTEEYIDEAKKWFRIAAQKGDTDAVEKLEIMEDWSPEDALEEKLDKPENVKAAAECHPLDFEQFGEYVEEAAKNGSVTAQEHMKIWKHLNEAVEAFKRNETGKLLEALAKAIRLHHQIVKIPEFYKPIIEKSFDPDNLDSVVCYIKMEREREEWPECIPKAFKQFPDDEYLADVTADYYCSFKKNLKAALKHIEMFLKRHPDSLRILLFQGIALQHANEKSDEFFKPMDAFLAAAPEDNPYILICHCSKAAFYVNIEDKQKFHECYLDILAAEKKQLPCFLPYILKYKRSAEMYYNLEGFSLPQGYHQERRKIDPKRNFLITQNRRLCNNHADVSNVMSPLVSTPCNPSNPPIWSNLKKITLKDMDSKKDKIYNGFVLVAQIIDWPIWSFVDSCIQTVVEDENCDVHRLTIQNWSSNDMLEIMKVLRPNVKFSITNPYYRITNDGKKRIFVQDFKYVKADTSLIDKLCHVCGKEAKTLASCSDCKMALYCSKECEELDQSEFNHGNICEQLKTYYTEDAKKSSCLLV